MADTPCPEPLAIGDRIERTTKPPSKSIYWTKGVAVGEGGRRYGRGFFNVEMAFLSGIGMDLETLPNPMIETLRLPFRILLPIVLMIVLSLVTAPGDKTALDRFYVKMKTPVNPDPKKDKEELEVSYRNPDRFEAKKLFPGTSLEITRWDKTDTVGFALGLLGTIVVIGLTLWVAGIGA
jgi:hypothetical protein